MEGRIGNLQSSPTTIVIQSLPTSGSPNLCETMTSSRAREASFCSSPKSHALISLDKDLRPRRYSDVLATVNANSVLSRHCELKSAFDYNQLLTYPASARHLFYRSILRLVERLAWLLSSRKRSRQCSLTKAGFSDPRTDIKSISAPVIDVKCHISLRYLSTRDVWCHVTSGTSRAFNDDMQCAKALWSVFACLLLDSDDAPGRRSQ